MKKLLNPRWIFLVHTLPLIIVFLISLSEYSLIKTLLFEAEVALWGKFCIAFLGLLLLNTGYAVGKILKNKNVDWIYSIISIIASVLFLCFYYEYYDDSIPWRVPAWMLSGNMQAYVGAFFMPSFIYNIFCLVIFLTKEAEKKSSVIQIVCAIFVPVTFYFLATQLISFWSYFSYSQSFLIIVVAIGVFIFLFFALRFLYIIRLRKPFNAGIRAVCTIAFGVFLPVIGLLLNNLDNIIGNFSDPWFLIIAVLNGFLLTLPDITNKVGRLCIYIARCITFSFTLYFFIVFLPLLPLGIVFILAAGLGILILTPLVLFSVHSNILWGDFKYLKIYYRPYVLLLILVLSLGVLPVAISGKYYLDRIALLNTLEYVYSPDYSEKYSVKQSTIQRTLNTLEADDKRYGFLLYSSTPFLESLYKKIVLHNLGLSYDKKQTLSRLFKGDKYGFSWKPNREVKEKDIRIIGLTHNSRYDVEKGLWISTVDMNIKNFSQTRWNTEYITYFTLPDGCWISDYYLNVNGKKEPGILAEKKAATWIFSQIRNRHRDPGLLTYVGGNTLEFKVFPFEEEEVRSTGFEFIHIEPVEFWIDGNQIVLGDRQDANYLSAQSLSLQPKQEGIYISAHSKKLLPTANLQPYYHFIVDVSGNSENSSYDLEESIMKKRQAFEYDIRRFLEINSVASKNYKITYANYQTHTVEKNSNEYLQINWSDEIPASMKPFKGGFFLQRAIEEIMVENYQNPTNRFPVIILLTEDIKKAVITKGFDDLKFAYPFTDEFYWLKGTSYLSIPLFGEWNKKLMDELNEFSKYTNDDYQLSLLQQDEDDMYYDGEVYSDILNEQEHEIKGSGHINTFSVSQAKLREYGTSYFVPDDDYPSIIPERENKSLNEFKGQEMEAKTRKSAMEIKARQLQHILNPKLGEKEWLPMLQASFASRILTSETAYIVVETEAQRLALKRKQEEVMSGHKNLDVGQEILLMSEPDLFMLLLLLAIAAFIGKKIYCKQ